MTGYTNWNLRAEVLCSNGMVETQGFLRMLNKILPSHEDNDDFAISNEIREFFAPTKDSRFIEYGEYVMLGDKTIAAKMDTIHGNLKLIHTIEAASNTNLEGITVMKEALRDLQESIAFLREHISNGKSVYNRETFESEYRMKWQE